MYLTGAFKFLSLWGDPFYFLRQAFFQLVFSHIFISITLNFSVYILGGCCLVT